MNIKALEAALGTIELSVMEREGSYTFSEGGSFEEHTLDDLTTDQRAAYDAKLAEQEAEAANAKPDLSARQWHLLLDASGAREVLDAVLDAMPKDTPEERFAWAQMRATALNSGVYRWATTKRLIEELKAKGVKGIPSEEELAYYWDIAVKDTGL